MTASFRGLWQIHYGRSAPCIIDTSHRKSLLDGAKHPRELSPVIIWTPARLQPFNHVKGFLGLSETHGTADNLTIPTLIDGDCSHHNDVLVAIAQTTLQIYPIDVCRPSPTEIPNSP